VKDKLAYCFDSDDVSSKSINYELLIIIIIIFSPPAQSHRQEN